MGCQFSVADVELVEKFRAGAHKLPPFQPLLLGLLRVSAVFEQRETNPEPAFWRLWPCAKASV
jgi:hypothetical protein